MPGHFGTSDSEDGLYASTTASDHFGVFGDNRASEGKTGDGAGGAGVFGLTLVPGGAGVFGANNSQGADAPGVGVQGNGPAAGVSGWSEKGVGVRALSGHIGIQAQAPLAAQFTGDVEVTGDIRLMGADCAEDFDVSDAAIIEPGTVMVVDDGGGVRVSDQAYDCRVAGVVSGAGHYRPAMILDRQGPDRSALPLALMGKVYCKVDARHSAVGIGDLLTTSSTPGHAMKASDRGRAFGAVIGKALQPCDGMGMIAILVALQ